MAQMTPEWIAWIDDNIARGVPPQTLIDTLLQHQFTAAQAEQAVRVRLPGSGPPATDAGDDQALLRLAAMVEQYQPENTGPQPGNALRIGEHVIQVRLTLERPRLIVFDNVLTADECTQLIALSRSKLARSTTVDETTGRAEIHAHRTSSGTFFAINETPFIARLDARIAALMQLPVENGEGLQILNYQVGGEYKPHYDYFPPEQPGSAAHIANGGQRVATLIVYLNQVEEGGGTVFPELGLSVAPAPGSAVYFAYCNSKDQIDPLTYHGGNPVIRGEKWIATKWMRQRAYR
ncbi:MAG TPA: 2OG-Fe(II) oxygenase [Burkholderiaceae bacterium]|nr:2OG-Fe(II) oxygenase [Burkholderiaceae bacterium]